MDCDTNTYWLDESLRITKVSEAWDQFAQDNNGEQAVGALVRGHSLWDFIVDDVTRMWLEVLIKLARMRQEQIERPYRCDSPELKRYMLMKITPEAANSLRIDHHLLSTAPRRRPVRISFAGTTPHISTPHRRCSMCGRIASADHWIEPDEDEGCPGANLMVIYTICGDCAKALEPGGGAAATSHIAVR